MHFDTECPGSNEVRIRARVAEYAVVVMVEAVVNAVVCSNVLITVQ
jgi:hypothetical protein